MELSNIYKQKYIKYKLKYALLKKQIGGSDNKSNEVDSDLLGQYKQIDGVEEKKTTDIGVGRKYDDKLHLSSFFDSGRVKRLESSCRSSNATGGICYGKIIYGISGTPANGTVYCYWNGNMHHVSNYLPNFEDNEKYNNQTRKTEMKTIQTDFMKNPDLNNPTNKILFPMGRITFKAIIPSDIKYNSEEEYQYIYIDMIISNVSSLGIATNMCVVLFDFMNKLYSSKTCVFITRPENNVISKMGFKHILSGRYTYIDYNVFYHNVIKKRTSRVNSQEMHYFSTYEPNPNPA